MLTNNLFYNRNLKNVKDFKATLEHKDFLIKANIIIFEINKNSEESLFAEMFERGCFF